MGNYLFQGFWDSYTRWQRCKLTGSGAGLRR
jgi:hypothetical protein